MASNVGSKWVGGNLVFYDKSGNIIFTIDGTNRKVIYPTPGALELAASTIVEAMIANGAVTSGKLANGAGIAALVTAGGGASATYANTTNGAQTILAANAGGDGNRTVLIVITVTEDFADNLGTQTEFTFGETDATTKYNDGTILAGASSGDIITLAGQLTEEKALLITASQATVDGTGAISVTVLALPES